MNSSPSSERRLKLKQIHVQTFNPPTFSTFLPLEKAYDLSNRLYDIFSHTYTRAIEISGEDTTHTIALFDQTYIYGLRYADFMLKHLPTHPYYRSNKAELLKLQKEGVTKLQNVVDKLEFVVRCMDKQEVDKLKFQKDRPPTELNKVKDAALARKLQNLRMQPPISVPLPPLSHEELVPSAPLPPIFIQDETATNDQCIFKENSATENFSRSPPSYDDFEKTRQFFKETLVDDTITSSIVDINNSKESSSSGVFVQPLITEVNQKYNGMRLSGGFKITRLKTFQGKFQERERNSTNGCTVIAALVAVQFLNFCDESESVSDTQVETIFDEISPPVLLKIRSTLGLTDNALIIPSDVHDYFINDNLLAQDQFVGVCGGDILNARHIQDLLNLLLPLKKAAVTFFFNEHVISILYSKDCAGQTSIDVIDSLSGAFTDDSFPSSNSISATNELFSGGARLTCSSFGGLQIFLRWYALTKFTKSAISYIEKFRWEDKNSDFDPRVYQAFVWSQHHR